MRGWLYFGLSWYMEIIRPVQSERNAKRYGLCIPISPRPLSLIFSYRPSGESFRSYIFTGPLSSILDTVFPKVNRGQPRSPSTSLTAHFSVLHLFCHSFITQSFDVFKPAEHIFLHSHHDILASTGHFWCQSAYLS